MFRLFCFVLSCFSCCVLFRLVSFRFVSFRFVFVSFDILNRKWTDWGRKECYSTGESWKGHVLAGGPCCFNPPNIWTSESESSCTGDNQQPPNPCRIPHSLLLGFFICFVSFYYHHFYFLFLLSFFSQCFFLPLVFMVAIGVRNSGRSDPIRPVAIAYFLLANSLSLRGDYKRKKKRKEKDG